MPAARPKAKQLMLTLHGEGKVRILKRQKQDEEVRTVMREPRGRDQWLGRLIYSCSILAATAVMWESGLVAKAGPLTTSQQLQMYRNCRKTYEGYNLYFAKKMCGCTVQAYIRNIPAEEAGVTCYKYAKTN